MLDLDITLGGEGMHTVYAGGSTADAEGCSEAWGARGSLARPRALPMRGVGPGDRAQEALRVWHRRAHRSAQYEQREHRVLSQCCSASIGCLLKYGPHLLSGKGCRVPIGPTVGV